MPKPPARDTLTTNSDDDHPFIERDEYLPALLSHINNRLSSGSSQLYLKHFGIGLNEWRVLSVLSNTPQVMANFIGQVVGMHKAVVSRSVRELEAKGLVLIDTSSGQRLMSLTETGQQMHDRIAVIAIERARLLVDGFSEEEQQMSLVLLRRMFGNLQRVNAWDPMASADDDGPTSDDEIASDDAVVRDAPVKRRAGLR